MDNFFNQERRKLDLSEIKSEAIMDYPYVQSEYDLETKKLHRMITLGEIMKLYKEFPIIDSVFGFHPLIHEIVADLKASYVLFDVRYLVGLGYKELYFKDLAPGDTSFSYDIYVEDN